ncbi:hypothetical protein ACIBG8_19425 [Nonomuraea sp. NPDC050556]|uniref:hypothetical protein n=1 Tax=Nonomuraea sp. NPDC050556 TaxID=3364369 RepID=UPI0037ACC77A
MAVRQKYQKVTRDLTCGCRVDIRDERVTGYGLQCVYASKLFDQLIRARGVRNGEMEELAKQLLQEHGMGFVI